MMTLDEAIEHAEQVAQGCEGECADDHRQLAEWLKELQTLKAENEQYRELIRILDHDWNIEASWDGLRRFWYVGLNERGVAERDEREAENERLKKRLAQYELFREVVGDPAHEFASLRRELHRIEREYIRLRKLVRDMWVNGMCECDECGAFAEGQYHCAECEYHYPDRMRNLGIEA